MSRRGIGYEAAYGSSIKNYGENDRGLLRRRRECEHESAVCRREESAVLSSQDELGWQGVRLPYQRHSWGTRCGAAAVPFVPAPSLVVTRDGVTGHLVPVPPRRSCFDCIPGSPTPALGRGCEAWATPMALWLCVPSDCGGRLASRGLRPFAFWPWWPLYQESPAPASSGSAASRLHGQRGAPGQLSGLPGGRRCKTSWGFCDGGVAWMAYTPPFLRGVFALSTCGW